MQKNMDESIITQPKVTIITLNWNGLADTKECLESLKKSTYKNKSIIVVDNGSRNMEAETLEKEYGNFVEVIKNKNNLGFAGGNNVAIKKVIENDPETQYIFLLNNDTTVMSNFLEEVLNETSGPKKYNMIACQMMNYYKQSEIDNLGLELTRAGLPFNIKKTGKTPFCPSGGAVLYSVRLLKDIEINGEYFDNDFFCVNEDLDLGFRAQLKGYQCKIAEKSYIYHKISRSSGGHMSDHNVYHYQRNLILFLVKSFPKTLLFRYGIWILLGCIGNFVLYTIRGKLKIVLKAYKDSFRLWKTMLQKRKIVQKIPLQIKNVTTNISPYIFPKEYLSNLYSILFKTK